MGKTTAAKTLATVLDAPLVRLQCYEGLTASEALYDWNYQRQLLSIRLAEARAAIDESDLYTEIIWSTARSCSACATVVRPRRCC